ncbi:MAG: hypothetical protein R3B47_20200 [Bacteroidia bacterium]
MTPNLDNIKFTIIKEIMSIDEEVILTRIRQDISVIRAENRLWEKIIQPTRSSITLEEMKKEQNYSPIEKDEFFMLAEEIGIEEPLEELLLQLD